MPELTTEILVVLAVLCVTLVLLVTEALRIDVVAIGVMIALPWLGIIPAERAFTGLSSGAVVAIMAVIIMGYGLDRSGVTQHVTGPIVRLGAGRPRRVRAALMGMIGTVSAFMQNVGAAALFLPIGLRVARESGMPASRLMMPMGFAAILGGTLTMIGSSPLILLNALLEQGGTPAFGLFAVTPIGLSLLVIGVLFFSTIGARLLPAGDGELPPSGQAQLIDTWALPDNVEEVLVPEGSALIGHTRQQMRPILRYGVHILAVREVDRTLYAPTRTTLFAAGQGLAVLGRPEDIEAFCTENGLRRRGPLDRFPEIATSDRAGYVELLVSPRSPLVGRPLHEADLRTQRGLEPLAVMSGGEIESRAFPDRELKAGDTILVHGPWKRIRELEGDRSLVLLTPMESTAIDRGRGWRAACCFFGAIALVFAGCSLPLSLFSGAVAMILLGVLSIDEAYRAVDWRTVFLLAGLIPLGIATDTSGTADYVAHGMFQVLEGAHPLVVMGAVAVLTTCFTLLMSNVATVVVLLPLVLDLGRLTGVEPLSLALLVGVCAQNSFLLPTHQVNALLMGPGGYRTRDYLRAGGALTALFLPVAILWIWWLRG